MTLPVGDEAAMWGPYSGAVTLDASGNGYVTFQARGEKVEITSLRVFASTNTKEALVNIYKGSTGTGSQIEGTLSGSSGDTTDTHFYLMDGEQIFVVWTGGDAGATATAVASGWSSTPRRGFRAIH